RGTRRRGEPERGPNAARTFELDRDGLERPRRMSSQSLVVGSTDPPCEAGRSEERGRKTRGVVRRIATRRSLRWRVLFRTDFEGSHGSRGRVAPRVRAMRRFFFRLAVSFFVSNATSEGRRS
ncbi:hypothetical protein ACHAWF_010080, partial [Thalassiosira exigua]